MDSYKTDGVICSMQALMQNGIVQMIRWVTTHNVTLCVTTTLNQGCTEVAYKLELPLLRMSLGEGNNTVQM